MFDMLNPLQSKLQPSFFMDADGKPAGDPPAGDPPDAGDKGGKSKQEDLDRQFQERARRGAENERKRILEALGVSSENDLATIVKAKREADEANKSELEKLQSQVTEATKALETLKGETSGTISTLQKRVIDTEIKIAASAPVLGKDGAVIRRAFRPDALDDILLLIEREGIKDEDGKIKGINEALDKLAKSKAYLLADDKPGPKPTGTPKPMTGTKQPKTNEQGDTPVRSVIGNSL